MNNLNSKLTSRKVLVLLCSVIFASCVKDKEVSNAEPATKTAATASAANDYWICIGDSNSKELKAFDPNDTNWNDAGSLKWYWEPTSGRNFTSAEITAFTGGTDWKIRNNTTWGGSNQVLAVTSNCFVALAEYGFPATQKGRKLWARSWSTPALAGNIHSAELLPNGNIAVAASDGGWVRVYNTSTPTSTNYVQYAIDQAHGVLWDPILSKLWTIGIIPGTNQCMITALDVGGTRVAPTLKEDTTRRFIFPAGGWPHDLSPYYGDTNKLWVACNSKVWIFNKSAKSVTAAPYIADLTLVKSVGNQPSGQIVIARPNGSCTSAHVTNTTTFYGASGTRTLTGSCSYKSRIFALPYQ